MTPEAGSAARRDYRIVVVDDHALFRESLELTLSIEGYDVHAVALPDESLSTAALASRIVRLRPRLVLVDLDLGSAGDGAALIGPLASAGIDVVVLTAVADRGRWGEAVRYGARKVLSKASPLREGLAVVRRLHQGLAVTTVEEREALIQHFMEDQARTRELRRRLGTLTSREAQVLGQLMLGRTVREIARAWVVSEATVRTQVKAVLAKLQVSSQVTAVAVARQTGWIAPAAATRQGLVRNMPEMRDERRTAPS